MPSMICRSISAVRNLLRSMPLIFSYAETCQGHALHAFWQSTIPLHK
jgi:hypothetical protein